MCQTLDFNKVHVFIQTFCLFGGKETLKFKVCVASLVFYFSFEIIDLLLIFQREKHEQLSPDLTRHELSGVTFWILLRLAGEGSRFRVCVSQRRWAAVTNAQTEWECVNTCEGRLAPVWSNAYREMTKDGTTCCSYNLTKVLQKFYFSRTLSITAYYNHWWKKMEDVSAKNPPEILRLISKVF